MIWYLSSLHRNRYRDITFLLLDLSRGLSPDNAVFVLGGEGESVKFAGNEEEEREFLPRDTKLRN